MLYDIDYRIIPYYGSLHHVIVNCILCYYIISYYIIVDYIISVGTRTTRGGAAPPGNDNDNNNNDIILVIIAYDNNIHKHNQLLHNPHS